MPVPTLRPRASTHSGLKRFSATQQNRSQLEMGQSVENFVPAEEQDDKLQQRPRDRSDHTPPPSSEDLGSNTSLPNSDLNIKIPQHLCEQHLSPTSKEPSTTINIQPRYVKILYFCMLLRDRSCVCGVIWSHMRLGIDT